MKLVGTPRITLRHILFSSVKSTKLNFLISIVEEDVPICSSLPPFSQISMNDYVDANPIPELTLVLEQNFDCRKEAH